MQIKISAAQIRKPLLALGLIASLFSCSKETSYDVKGISEPIVYLYPISNTERNADGKDNVVKIRLFVATSTFINNNENKFLVYSTVQGGSDVQTHVEVRNDLIAEYNRVNNTNYGAAPEGIILLKNSNATIPAGASVSADTVSVSIDPTKGSSFDRDTTFVVPVEITSTSNGKISENRKTAYIVYKTKYDDKYIWNEASIEDVRGQFVTDRSGWRLYTTSTSLDYQYGSGALALDNDAYSTWNVGSNNGVLPIIADLGKIYSIGGFACYSDDFFGGNIRRTGAIPFNSKIYISTDNTNWTYLGVNTRYPAERIVFYGTVRTRYIRIDIPEATLTFAFFDAGNFNIYAN